MSARRHGMFVASALLVGVLLRTATAGAGPTTDQCIQANGKGQDLFHDGKLGAARVQLASCSSAACPTMIRNDCTKRLDALDKAQPAIVFVARDAADNDLGAVAVTVDGAPLTSKLDGTALRVDPGEHAFVFTTAGFPSVTKNLVLAEGDQSRTERIQFTTAPNAQTDGPPPPVRPPQGMSPVRLWGFVVGGAGIAGLGVGAVFGVLTGSAWNSQKSDCSSPTDCPRHAQAVSDHSTVVTDSTVATVGFVAGGVLLAAGVAMVFLGRPSFSGEATTTGLVVAPSISPTGGGMLMRGVF